MATVAEVSAVASACKDVSKAAKSLKFLSAQLLANNSAQGIDWGALPEGSEANGAIINESFTAAEVSNVLGSLAEFATFWVTHGGNFEKLTSPIV